MIRIVILGSGNVAYSLSHAIAQTDLNLVQICARNREKGQALASECGCEFTSEYDKLAEADLYIISVSDKAIASVAKKIKTKDCVVAHTAGSDPVTDIESLSENKAVLYPFQTFTHGLNVDLQGVPIMIEGSNTRSLACVRLVADKLSQTVLEANSDKRRLMHLAAVFACNFSNHMYAIGERLMNSEGLSFDLLKPLIAETTRTALGADSPTNTQTGPAIRNEYQTKAVHCEMLSEQADLKTMYINLSNSIWETSKKM